ncbi:MAG: NADH-quinone oxidoreductase subunit C [Burkholderiales bacterium]|nr:NADH-quinone oxidoreductase subunit C [Burkholderiales bacterium]
MIDFEGMVRTASIAPAWTIDADAAAWRKIALACSDEGGRLVSIWGQDDGEGFLVFAAFVFSQGMLIAKCRAIDGKFRNLVDIFPCAGRMQRAVADMLGIVAEEGDGRPWLSHGAWPEFPLRRDYAPAGDFAPVEEHYPFVTVEGEGVHEIAVGPVHAGTIEPGHFRFQVVGEKVLRLEERLGYKHKGIEKAFEGMALFEGAELAARISGDSTVAYSWAYAMAAECICGIVPQPRASFLRGLFLERERIANHLADLGALGNDAGFAFGLAQFSVIREDMLRANNEMFGHRYLMDAIVPGGVSRDVDGQGKSRLLGQCEAIRKKLADLHEIYIDHTGLQDRFLTTGRVSPELAAKLGLTGLAGRASRIACDLREDHPYPPYDMLDVAMATHHAGDVAARVSVRFEEIVESLRLIETLIGKMPEGDIMSEIPACSGFGVGWVEGFRGEVLVALEAENGIIRRAHAHDPSWQNWPVLEFAVIGNIVPDFPLINKSFNLSYSGHDL